MKKCLKFWFLASLCTGCALLVCGCSGREIDDIAYVVAAGVDMKDDGGYSFTFAVANPRSMRGGEGEGGDENTLVTEVADGENIFVAMRKIAERTGQETDFSHAELMVLSDAVAKHGVTELAEGVMYNLFQRPRLAMITTSGAAGDYISSIYSEFEGNPVKYLEKVFENFPGTVADNKEFLCRTKNPCGGIAICNGENKPGGTEVDYMSAFYCGRCIGRIYDVEIYGIINGSGGKTGQSAKGAGTLILNQRKKPHIEVECGKVPHIKIDIELDGAVESICEGANRKQLEESVKSDLEERAHKTLTHISTVLQTDVTGFFRYGRKCFADEQDWEKYNWYERFKNAVFTVNIKIIPEKTGLIKGGA